jgi:hypothetical protein
MLGDQNNNTNITAVYGQQAISRLSNEINGKKIKVIVTGGFHSQGLEAIARERKISYIQITPKITKDISRAGETHWNIIRGYRQVLDNTINSKPLTETWLNVLFPEILARALIATNEIPEIAKLNILQKKQLINEVIDEAIKTRTFNDKITVTWKIEEFENNKVKITATYTDDKNKKYDEEYIFDGKSLQTIGQNDAKNAPQKLSENTESVQSILNNLFKNTKTFGYKLYTTVIAPIWEEFVFRFIPFAIAGSLATALPVSITAIAVIAIISIITFPSAHIVADKVFFKKAETRKFSDFVVPSIVFTSIYVIFGALFPAIPLAGVLASIIAHSMYNAVILLAKDMIEKGTTKKSILDRIIARLVQLKPANVINNTFGEQHFYKPSYLKVFENMLPENVIGSVKSIAIAKIRLNTVRESVVEKNSGYESRFDIFESIAKNNYIALESLNKGTKNSLADTMFFVEKMITGLSKLNINYGQKAKIALHNIRENLGGEITLEVLIEQSKLKSWSAEAIDEINNIHTLINAVHQISIEAFMGSGNSENILYARKIMLNSSLEIYDFSKNGMNPEIKDFLVNIDMFLGSYFIKEGISKIYVKDGKIFYDKTLGSHALSMFIDFDNPVESIMISFYDSGRRVGAALRSTVLASLLATGGFDIASFDNRVDDNLSGTCGFRGVWSCSSGDLRKVDEYSKVFIIAFYILFKTTDLDVHFDEAFEDDFSKNNDIELKILKKSQGSEYFKALQNTQQFPKDIEDEKKKGFQYLSVFFSEYNDKLHRIKSVFKLKTRFEPIYDYFNLKGNERRIGNVERMYVEDYIRKNETTGYLEINKNYKPMAKMIEILNDRTEIDDSFRKAQLLNLLPYSNMHLRPEGYIGAMIAKSGVLNLSQGWLSVKVVVDAEEKECNVRLWNM